MKIQYHCPICGRQSSFPGHQCDAALLRRLDAASKRDNHMPEHDPNFNTRLKEGFRMLGESEK